MKTDKQSINHVIDHKDNEAFREILYPSKRRHTVSKIRRTHLQNEYKLEISRERPGKW
jgi:hypothetical protein